MINGNDERPGRETGAFESVEPGDRLATTRMGRPHVSQG